MKKKNLNICVNNIMYTGRGFKKKSVPLWDLNPRIKEGLEFFEIRTQKREVSAFEREANNPLI